MGKRDNNIDAEIVRGYLASQNGGNVTARQLANTTGIDIARLQRGVVKSSTVSTKLVMRLFPGAHDAPLPWLMDIEGLLMAAAERATGPHHYFGCAYRLCLGDLLDRLQPGAIFRSLGRTLPFEIQDAQLTERIRSAERRGAQLAYTVLAGDQPTTDRLQEEVIQHWIQRHGLTRTHLIDNQPTHPVGALGPAFRYLLVKNPGDSLIAYLEVDLCEGGLSTPVLVRIPSESLDSCFSSVCDEVEDRSDDTATEPVAEDLGIAVHPFVVRLMFEKWRSETKRCKRLEWSELQTRDELQAFLLGNTQTLANQLRLAAILEHDDVNASDARTPEDRQHVGSYLGRLITEVGAFSSHERVTYYATTPEQDAYEQWVADQYNGLARDAQLTWIVDQPPPEYRRGVAFDALQRAVERNVTVVFEIYEKKGLSESRQNLEATIENLKSEIESSIAHNQGLFQISRMAGHLPPLLRNMRVSPLGAEPGHRSIVVATEGGIVAIELIA